MAEDITIRKSPGKWVVRAGGAVLVESSDVLELHEAGHAPVQYFPRGDVAMAFLERTDHSTHCPHKGDANYYSIVTKSQTIENTAWTYEAPKPAVAEIKDHLAFYHGDRVTVEEI